MRSDANLYVPAGLRAHKLSAAVGSGKTRAAIRWLASPSNATRNVLYVAPTKALVDQTAVDLKAAIAAVPGAVVRNVHKVHAVHADTAERGQVHAEALAAINSVDGNEGAAQLLTTSTFLAIVAKVKRPEQWTVILDEAFDPATFTTFQLGASALRGWGHFCELFEVDPAQGYRILPREGRKAVVEEVAQGRFSTAGDFFRALEDVARAVANPAIRCELVMTEGALALLAGEEPKKRKSRKVGSNDEPGTVLELSSYVDPAAFAGFRDVLFLSALFEETILFQLWTRALGVTFKDHPEFPSHLLRDTHKEQGRFLAVGHLLHKDDPASLDNLGRDIATGLPTTRKGTRVVDYMVQTAADHFGGERFLLQTNQRYGFKKGDACVPPTAEVIPAFAHGLNTFQGVDNVAALALTNPNPQRLGWVRARTGMSAKAVTRAFRIHTTYQALGRCSIRRAEPTTTSKVVLVAGHDDARFICDLFPGAHWLGQVGTLPSLHGLREEVRTREPGKAEALAETILRHLAETPETVQKLGSKTLKAAVEAGLRAQEHLNAIGADEQVGGIDRNLWQRALSLACLIGRGWQKHGQSLHRVTAQLYGF